MHYPDDLTPRQHEFLSYLHNRMRQGKGMPSLREAAKEQGVSHTAVASLFRALEDKGVLRREGRYSRSIVLQGTQSAESFSPSRVVPIIGRVAAGLPLYAQQEWAGTVLVDSAIFRGEQLFALRVQGDSMKDVGILDGDLAICEARQFAQDGEIVVALLNNEEATVKRFFYRGDHIELKPENPDFTAMRYGLGEVLIQGKVIGIQRGPDQLATL
ncbi:MAG: transcriptional repressor LexA [Desulfobulbus sp.]|jgi:repressor LexA